MSKIVLVSAVLLMLLVCIAPASAGTFASNNDTYVSVANDAGARLGVNGVQYYFNFAKPTGGLKAIHISDDYTDVEGGIIESQSFSGTFYITDTSTDTQYHDDAILMFAIPSLDYSTELNDEDNDLSIEIIASGYQWTPTGDGSKPASPTYNSSGLSESFGMSDFLADTSEWRPAGTEYPVYNGQGANEEFKFMFIDLNLGTLNDTALALTNYGAVEVNYTISNYSGKAAFDAYAYCNQSAQGQGVSWTNKAIDDSKSSGWTIGF